MLCKILDEPNGSHFQRKDVSNAVVFGTRAWHQTDKLIRNYRDTIMVQLKLKTENTLPLADDFMQTRRACA
jgi:hypothetical protein